MPQVERKIYFYRIDSELDEAGRPHEFEVAAVLRHINSLPFTNVGRYLDAGDGNAICCWGDRSRSPQRLRIATLRRSGLPQVEQAGRLSPLGIPRRAGLVEQVHVVFFPDGIVGSEFNFYGPRLSRLSHYLAIRVGDVSPPVTFTPLLRQDVREQLDRLRDIRLLRIMVRAPYAQIVAQADQHLGAAFDAARRAGDAEELEILLRSRPRSRARLANRLLGTVRQLAGHRDIHESVSRFVVKGFDPETNRVEEIDVLSDQLIARKQIVLESPRTRALDAGSAYGAIEEAYRELRADLQAAAGVEA